MLVLSRRLLEKIHIGDDITVMICAIQGDKVRLGITAPANVSVHRSEVLLRIREEMAAREGQEESESC